MTEAEYQALVITELVDDSSGTLAINVPLYWARRASVTDLELRFLLVKRDALILMLGKAREDVDRSSGDDSIKASQVFDHLLILRRDIDGLIAAYPVADATLTMPHSTHVKHRIVW